MLVNVAGTEFEGPFCEGTNEELRNLLNLNITAGVEMTRRALDFRDSRLGLHIIMLSSLAAFYPMPLKAAYAASKRFLLDFSRALNQELKPLVVSVTAVCPSGLPTNPRSIRGLERQGVWGMLSMGDVGDVVHTSVEYALRGKSVYVPGLLNNLLRALAAVLPADVMARLISRRWQNAWRQSSSGNS
jgi:short-subunit dehydrogenase